VRRYVGATSRHGIEGFNVIPGGSSGDPASPLYAAQLPLWLTGDHHDVEMGLPGKRRHRGGGADSDSDSGKDRDRPDRGVLSDERFVPPPLP
jgi:hypothetical protein